MKNHVNIKKVLDEWMFNNFSSEYMRDRLIVNFEVSGFKNLYLYTNFPGVIVGKYGRCLKELEDMLKANKIKKKIRIVELTKHEARELSPKHRLF